MYGIDTSFVGLYQYKRWMMMPSTHAGIAFDSAMRPLPPFSRIVLAIALTVVGWETRRRTRRAIRHLDPHLLRDIGLDPGAARAESLKPFWQG